MKTLGWVTLVSLMPVVALAQPWQLTASAEHISYSESLPVWSLLNGEFSGPLREGDQAFTQSRYGVSAQWGNWAVSWVNRLDAFARYNAATAELLHKEENDQAHQGAQYPLEISMNLLQAQGLGLSYQAQPSPGLQLTVTPYVWQGQRTLDGRVDGSVSVAGNSFDASLATDYHFTDDFLFDRQVDSDVQALGASLDLALQWQLSEQLELHVQARDLFHRVYWSNLPYTRATASTSNQLLDKDGNVAYKPVFSGIEAHGDYTQRLPENYRLKLAWQQPAYRLEGGARFHQDTWFPEVAIGWQLGESRVLKLGYQFTADALTLGYHGQRLELALTASDWQLAQANALGLVIGLNVF